MLFPKNKKRLGANGTWKMTFRRRRGFSRFPYLEKYIAVKGSIVRPLFDVPWNERRTKISVRRCKIRRRGRIVAGLDITKGCVSFDQSSLSLSLPWNSWTTAKSSGWLPRSPPCHWIMDGFICSWQNPAASPRGDENRRVKFGVKSALRCDGTWIFISVPGCGLFRTPPELAYFKRKSVRTEGGCKFLLLFSFYSTSGKWGDLIKWNFIRESFYNYSISR